MGEVMRMALSQGYCDQVLTALQYSYRRRCQLLCSILLQTEPGIRLLPQRIPLGGYFVWISSFDGIEDTSHFLEYCQSRGVSFLPGIRCAVTNTTSTTSTSSNNDRNHTNSNSNSSTTGTNSNADTKDNHTHCHQNSDTPKDKSNNDDYVSQQYALCRRAARLCFADMNETDLQDGAHALIQCYRDYIA
jgi:hypothetical protein